MEFQNHHMNLFLKEVQNAFRHRKVSNSSLEGVYNFPLNKLECMYLFDFSKNKILFHKGFDKVFGYELEEPEMDFIFSKYHPEDAPMIKSVIKGTVSQLINSRIPEFSDIMNMAYRFRRSDGKYARILSKTTVCQTDDDDRIVSVLIRHTDVSFTSESDAVEWVVDDTYLDPAKLAEQVYGEERLIFTPRELEIIKIMFEGATNLEISRALFISQHTVATHRKNILLKSNCHNTNQLKDYCIKNGIHI